MNSKEIRKRFLDFFAKNGHPVIESSPLIPYGDSSLLFTSAGMVQFKPYYLGLKDDLKRAASCQKCFRTTDIDNVGKTIRHLTFFEMLGNFSFGDYFKEESLKWGYEFLTKEMGIDPNRLYFSVYKGGVAPKDEEAVSIWKKILPKELHSHIFEMGEDNFWSMGDTGPSGPCSEIYYDRGEEFSHKGCSGPSCGCDRYIEIWNHVFTQFDRQTDGSFKPLPKKNIDTGMGLERLTFVVENKFSPFETSLFYPMAKKLISDNYRIFTPEFKEISDIVNSNLDYRDYYEKIKNKNGFELFIPALRVISDHIRGANFLISEGVLPSNEGRGYILRRLIRRAVRYAMLLGIKDTYVYKLADSVNEIYLGVYDQISENLNRIKDTIKYEEEGFLKTIENGEVYIKELISKGEITGEEAFKIYETYGFPYELIKEIALKKGIKINDEEFERAKKKAQEISRKWKGEEKDLSIFHKINSEFKETGFLGYENYSAQSKLIGIIDENGRKIEKADNGEFWLVFEKTVFYAESGGQVSDIGVIYKNGRPVAEVLDVQKPMGDVFYHRCKINETILVGEEYELKIDVYRRKKIAANHTATHLINSALKKIFGPNTVQAGSLVNEEKFRFDYTINKTPSYEEIIEVEKIANEAIMEGYKVYKQTRPLSDAKELGAVVLPGEKYSDPARFVLINHGGFEDSRKYSLELCGGTHVDELKDVFKIKILKDSSLSRGVRRIEGTAGYSLIEWLEKRNGVVERLTGEFGCSEGEIFDRISKLNNEIKSLKNKIQNFSVSDSEDFISLNEGLKLVFVRIPDSDIKLIRNISDKKKSSYSRAFLFVYSLNEESGKINFVFSKTEDNPKSVLEVFEKMKKLGFKAGGRADFIQGGGSAASDRELKEKISSVLK
ncbi:MAG: alanine--tRNA ligase [Elusimicrobiota bacterium]